MHNANYYLPLLSPEATQAVSMVAGGIYAAREKLSEWPTESTEKPFWLSELLFTAIFHGHSTSAYRFLTRSKFDSVQTQIENFMWDEYRHVHRYSSEVSRILSDMPDTEALLDYLIKNTDFELYLMDAQEYAEEPMRRELKSKGLIFKTNIMTADEFERDKQKYKIQNKGIKTHHLLLSALADCGCCPFKATPLSNKLFPETAGEIYYDCRLSKAPASNEDWLANMTLRVRIHRGRPKVELASGCGTFDQFVGSSTAEDLKLRLFIPTRPPLFLESELNQFEQLLETGSSEKEIQSFFENHTNFLRALGFGGFRAQVHLIPQGSLKTIGNHSSSLYIDLLTESVTGSKSAIIELKQAISPLLRGPKRRRNIVSSFSDALRQLEDYSAFFEDSRNREWFVEKYGQDIGCPELMLVIGKEDLSTLGISSMLHTPIRNKTVRVLSYQDIVDSVRCQNFIIPDRNYDLE